VPGPWLQRFMGKVMKPILTFLAQNGIRNIMYLDDGRTAASTKAKADRDYGFAIDTFAKAGFAIFEDKSDKVGDSAQGREYLGFKIDRDVASMVGKLIALEPALGRSILVGTRLATIAIVIATEVSEASKLRSSPWSKRIILDNDTLFALSEVLTGMTAWNRWPIRCWHTGITLSSILPYEAMASLDRKIPERRVHDRRAVMTSDASDFAVASYSVKGLPEFTYSSKLTLEERAESSTCRELLAIFRTLQHLDTSDILVKSPREQTTLWWLTDNQNVEKILAKGSGILRLTKLGLDILRVSRRLLFNFQPIWVRRDNLFLMKADAISKGIDTDNWEVSSEDFQQLTGLLGPF
jgi:hypothetical protein